MLENSNENSNIYGHLAKSMCNKLDVMCDSMDEAIKVISISLSVTLKYKNMDIIIRSERNVCSYFLQKGISSQSNGFLIDISHEFISRAHKDMLLRLEGKYFYLRNLYVERMLKDSLNISDVEQITGKGYPADFTEMD